MAPIIRVADLSKIYKLYRGPRSLFKEIFLGIQAHTAVNALSEVTLEVAKGETFGVVGNNGAGKSTLLKVLAGTAFPTSGTAEVKGSVSALLELGTGFHPQFSGRQNIYFNGALMGLRRDEIQQREKDIVEFSGLQEFIDEPVKTYSSGMYLRLGFSVATGFDSSILIIDEALAVGDQQFQKKCTDRILEFKRSGGTILFCSHNLYQVRTLCDQALWLHRGQAKSLGPAADVVDEYTHFIRDPDSGETSDHREPTAPGICWIEEARLLDKEGKRRDRFRSGEDLFLEVWAHFSEGFEGTPAIGVSIVRNDGVLIYTTSSTMDRIRLRQVETNRYYGRIQFLRLPLLSGRYHFNLSTTDQENMQAYNVLERAEPFTVSDPGPDFGLLRMDHSWIHDRSP
jgi:ABC-type polysaccharide/polyol phosphate transport system ATPase subunit